MDDQANTQPTEPRPSQFELAVQRAQAACTIDPEAPVASFGSAF